MEFCSICRKRIEEENAPLLVMGGFGTPRYICDECDADLGEATSSRDTDSITAAMARLGEKIKLCDPEDKLTLKTVREIMQSASERAERIKNGEYDFSADEIAEEDAEIPPELLETEEDKAAAEAEEKSAAKVDKITNIICLVILAAVVGFCAYLFLKNYFL